MFCVYEIYGNQSPAVYIGYCTVTDKTPLQQFLKGGLRSEEDRRDVQFVELHGGEHNLVCRTLEMCDEEIEAFEQRNLYRARTPYSFTGPTAWPTDVHARAMKSNPKKYEHCVSRWKQRAASTAREAYEMGLFDYDTVKKLCALYTRPVVTNDLATLSPDEFVTKYAIVIV